MKTYNVEVRAERTLVVPAQNKHLIEEELKRMYSEELAGWDITKIKAQEDVAQDE